MVHKRFSVLVLASLFLGLLFQIDATAQGQVTLDARAGYDGYFKPNNWIPIHVVIANEGADIDGHIQVVSEDNWQKITYTQPAVLPTHSRKQFTLYVYAQYNSRELVVRLAQGTKTLVSQAVRVQPIDEQDFLYGVASDDPSALNYLAGLPSRGNRRVHVAHLDLADLPTQGRVLTGMDMLILDSLDTSPLSSAQREALRGWVALGGHLVICGGPHAVPTAAGLGDLLPVTIQGSETTTDLSELGEYARAPFIAQIPAVVAQVTQVLAGAPGRPFLVRQSLDAGRIDYLALDPDLEPMRTWIGNDNLWPRLAYDTPLSERLDARSSWGNIANALANVPSMAAPSVLLVIGFLLLYVVVVGPLNFLVLKWTDRRTLAWLTVPALVLMFSCVAYVIGFASRGRRVVVSEISIVRPRTSSQTAVVDSFVGLYSPSRRRYDIRLPDNVLVHHAYPVYSPGGFAAQEITVEQGPPTWLRGVEIDVGEMRDFAMQTVQPWPGIEADLTLTAIGSAYHVEGTIANRSDGDIRNGVLLFQALPVTIPDIAAGETRSIAVDFQSSSSLPTYRLVDELLSNLPADVKERERERRREMLYGVFQYGPQGAWASTQELAGLVLIGWMSESPQPVDIVLDPMQGVETPSIAHATVLLLAPLPTSVGDPDTVIVPLRSMRWEYAGTGSGMSPYELYRDTGNEVFVFSLPPDAQGLAVEKLSLHVDSLDGFPYGSAPVVSIMDVASQQWQAIEPLNLGANQLVDPQRYVNQRGEIEVKVATNTIQAPISVDLSAILRRE
jgi:hypothetical protein